MTKKIFICHFISHFFISSQPLSTSVITAFYRLLHHKFFCNTKVMIFRVVFNNAEEVAS